ncbi:thiol:disulfide interchange protein DsbD [Arachidicoccus rhizosphaerae]|uniref:Thiol:disulfide interchange protein DsbD n=1 Tax=Arachidicoccus rhizosphaerae TaxID=551991 RepID=A0A1H4A4R9_9BACT|nr:protein-disulfide reductase DsbD domain-containing protein [Arachidicoccus rhizosphaerae]SEA31093.1 thiol:disulfide interchange protein DsbD [Arachidicoccus rhizosphaerae]
MKKLLCMAVMVLGLTLALNAQPQSPVKWTAAAEKSANGNYTLTLTATVPAPWHIYSQSTPDGGPVPTSISFNKNPLITVDGKAAEKGVLKTTHDKNFGVDVKYYAGKVQFVQKLKVKAGVKTNVTGTVNFMVCNDQECLPPSGWDFSVKLN